jgi:multiple sugar transport system permease protein
MWLYNPQFGLFNLIFIKLGLNPQQWIYGIKSVIPSLILMSIWSIGNVIIIFLAGLQDIPKELMEAVEIDGGSMLAKFKHVTLPLMSPIIFYNVVMGIIMGFQTFTQSYIMTNGGPANASLFFVLHLYRQAFMFSNMGYACALAWFLFVITGIVTVIVFKTSSSWVFYQGGKK